MRTMRSRGLISFATVVLLSRLLLLSILSAITHGHELSNDVQMHMSLIRHPSAVLLYTIPGYEQHPPFLPFVETWLGYPLQLVLSDFFTLRLVMIGYEVGLACLFFNLLQRLEIRGMRRNLCLVAFILLPSGWMTSTIMGQDDSIAACAFILPILLYACRRRGAALFLSGIGVIAAKLFIALDIVVLLATCTRRTITRSVLLALGPIVLVYGAMSVHRLLHGYPLPLLGFRPNPYYGTNFWTVLQRTYGWDLHKLGILSGLLALAASTLPAPILLKAPPDHRSSYCVVLAAAASGLLFFSLFYHVEPEYFLIVVPLLIATSENWRDWLGTSLIAVVPWTAKFFQNAVYMANANINSGKFLALRVFRTLFHSAPVPWLTADQLLFSGISICVAILWCLKLRSTLRLTANGALLLTQSRHSVEPNLAHRPHAES
jgi:hypothetical protein